MGSRARRIGAIGAAAVTAGLLLVACGGGTPSGSDHAAAPATATDIVTISNFMFSPMTASVAPGATVTVVNNDAVTHTLTATGGQFDTGDIAAGHRKTFTAPDKPGSYHYICNIHQYMVGTIDVR